MNRLTVPLALGLLAMLGTPLTAQDRIHPDGGPTIAPPDPAPAAEPAHGPPAQPVAVWTSHDPAGPAPAPAPQVGRGDGPPAPPAKPAMPATNAATLKLTTVTAHLLETMPADKNLVWCSSMQLCWDEFTAAAGGPLQLNNEPAMAKALNAHLATKADLDAASYLAMGGMVKDDIIPNIQKALDARFPNHDDFFKNAMEGPHTPEELIAFAYLSKNLAFKTPFYTQTKNPLTFSGKAVKTFGVWSEAGLEGWSDRAAEVTILDEISRDEFIVELKTTAANDRLILARVPAGATLKETIDTAMSRIAKGQPSPFGHQDIFMAPVIDFHIVRDFPEIKDHTFTAAVDHGDRRIKAALQDTRFKLDETGAMVISQAVLDGPGGARLVKPRAFLFDKPFLVLMLRKDAKMPYLALWIDNAELLTANPVTVVSSIPAADPKPAPAPAPAPRSAPPAPPAPGGAPLQRGDLQTRHLPAQIQPIEN